MPLLIHLPREEHLCCLQSCMIVNRTSININVQAFCFLDNVTHFCWDWPWIMILLLCLSHSWDYRCVPYVQLFSWDGVSLTFCLDWFWTVILPISSSSVTGSGVSHYAQPQIFAFPTQLGKTVYFVLGIELRSLCLLDMRSNCCTIPPDLGKTVFSSVINCQPFPLKMFQSSFVFVIQIVLPHRMN
jgi:hypothetical protein